MPRKLENIVGVKYGNLTVKEYAGTIPVGNTKQSAWECICDCGNLVVVLNNNLKKGNTQSCGCYQSKRAFECNFKDLTGQKFEMLTVKSFNRTHDGNSYWNCQCDCGCETIVAACSLKKAKSCGCKQGNFIHGEWSKGLANYSKFRRQDPLIKLKHNVSSSIRSALKSVGSSKSGHKTMSHLPYSIEELKQHLENLWEPWMNWDNYGGTSDDARKTWHIDHIKPHCNFSYKSMTDELFTECWSLSNLRPLEKISNMSKGSKE
jgi:hypothetical protein